MSKRGSGPRIAPPAGPAAPRGPRVGAAQPQTPPTIVQIGGDRAYGGAREVDFAQLTPDPDQPRKHMNPERLAELSQSIVDHGLLQPIVVRQAGLDRGGDMRYIVVAGGRRYAAIKLALETTGDDAVRARLARVPVVINDSEAAERRVLQLIENLQREDLNGVEEARALKEIARIEGLTTTGLAGRVHRSQGYVDERLRLLRHEDVEDAVATGLLTKSAGAAIASIPAADDRQEWLARARRGEVVRPREVYASKPGRRPRRAATPSGADPALLAAIARRSIALREADPALTREEAFHLAAVEARDAGTLDPDTTGRVLGAAARYFNPADRPSTPAPDPAYGDLTDPFAADVAALAGLPTTTPAAPPDYPLPPLDLLTFPGADTADPGDTTPAALLLLTQSLRATRARLAAHPAPHTLPGRADLAAELRALLALLED